MQWQLAKLSDNELIFGSKTKGKYWVQEFDKDTGEEKCGEFFETMEEAMDAIAWIEDMNFLINQERNI